jgi:N-acetylmuramoyl-L-alanine amidase
MFTLRLLRRFAPRNDVILFMFIFFPCSLHAAHLAGRVIVLDPGHAVVNYEGKVINAGKNRNNLWEHAMTMKIVQELGAVLTSEGAKVLYTRTPADYWREAVSPVEDNKARAFFANEMKADAFLAIHCDWDPRPRISGVTTLYETPASKPMGALIHRNLIRTLKANDRNLVHDTFTILDNAEMPAVIIETGFLSNRSESKKLSTPEYRQKIARAIATGLETYFSK